MPKGAAKGRRCTICQHPQRPNIDLAIATGISRRLIAARFKVSADAAWRHGHEHLTPEIRAALATTVLAGEGVPHAGGSITNVLLSPDFRQLRAKLLRVLARYPEARDEVAAVFRRAGQRAAAEMGAPAASGSGERVLSLKGEPLKLIEG